MSGESVDDCIVASPSYPETIAQREQSTQFHPFHMIHGHLLIMRSVLDRVHGISGSAVMYVHKSLPSMQSLYVSLIGAIGISGLRAIFRYARNLLLPRSEQRYSAKGRWSIDK